jgi:hypothetical protein
MECNCGKEDCSFCNPKDQRNVEMLKKEAEPHMPGGRNKQILDRETLTTPPEPGRQSMDFLFAPSQSKTCFYCHEPYSGEQCPGCGGCKEATIDCDKCGGMGCEACAMPKEADFLGNVIKGTVDWIKENAASLKPLAAKMMSPTDTSGTQSQQALMQLTQELKKTPAGSASNTRSFATLVSQFLTNQVNESEFVGQLTNILKKTGSQKSATPTAWSVDNDREEPVETKHLDTEQQLLEKEKNGSKGEKTNRCAECGKRCAAEEDVCAECVKDMAKTAAPPELAQLATKLLSAMEQTYTYGKGNWGFKEKELFDALKEFTNDPAPDRSSGPLLASKEASEGGAEEEEETEEQSSTDAVIVSLLDSVKTEWSSLGEPVNPSTWPKEIERAILDLNEAVIKSIESIQTKLVEGDYYSKNVDEGVDQGGGSMMNDLNVPGVDPDEMTEPGTIEDDANTPEPMDYEKDELHLEDDKKSSKTGGLKTAGDVADISTTETKKAMKFVEELQGLLTGKFFDFKKTVEFANNSAAVKNTSEDIVKLKNKLDEVLKLLGKQFTALEAAETAIEEATKKKKTSAFDGQPLAVQAEAEKIVKELKKKPEFQGKDAKANPYAVALSQARKTVAAQKRALLSNLTLPGIEN